jgi:hypothetical protein
LGAIDWTAKVIHGLWVAFGVVALIGSVINAARGEWRPALASLVLGVLILAIAAARHEALRRSGSAVDRKPNSTCPICGAPVVLAGSYARNRFTSPMAVLPTREERVAACAEHGRPPFNDWARDAAAL